MPSEIVGPFCCSVHSPSKGTLPLGPRQFGWQFARGTRQFGNMFSAIRLLGACPKRGYIGHSAGNSGGNSRAIHGNSGRFSAIRVFCACPKRRKFGNSLPTQFPFKNFKKGKRTEYPWMHCARSNNSRILPYKTLETGGDGVLEFYHGHCGSAMEAAEFFLAETRVCGIPCHWRIHCALPAKK